MLSEVTEEWPGGLASSGQFGEVNLSLGGLSHTDSSPGPRKAGRKPMDKHLLPQRPEAGSLFWEGVREHWAQVPGWWVWKLNAVLGHIPKLLQAVSPI